LILVFVGFDFIFALSLGQHLELEVVPRGLLAAAAWVQGNIYVVSGPASIAESSASNILFRVTVVFT
jgi:hypothetical protein